MPLTIFQKAITDNTRIQRLQRLRTEKRASGAGGAAKFLSGRRSLPGFWARADRPPQARTPAILLTALYRPVR